VWQGQRVAVIIPAFNEARLIGETVAAVPHFVDRVIVVDDASNDQTWSCLSACRSPRLVRLRHSHNRGVGAAITSGYYRALRDNCDLLAVMAGDNQMRPEELPELLDAALHGADYAKGNRLLHQSRQRMPRLRRWGSRALSKLTRATTGLEVGDCQCGYTVLRAETAAALPLDDVWPRYGYPNDLLALLARGGARVRDVPVSAVYAGESSGLHAGHMFSIAMLILRRWRQQPLRSGAHVPPSAITFQNNPQERLSSLSPDISR
jgi:glycosyltransferase involved in cell wall biosynthesis